jgi:hypothetical protein
MATGMTTPLIGGPRQQPRNVRNPMRQRHREEILNEVAYIYNITAQTWPPIYRTHSVTVLFGNDIDSIPDNATLDEKIHDFGVVAGISYSRALVRGRIEYVESGIESSRGVLYDEVSTEAPLIAQDIVDHCNEDFPRTEDGVPSFAGIFWSAAPTPTEGEIKAAQKKLYVYYKALISEADRLWSNEKTRDHVTTLMKTAFKTMKEAGKVEGDKPWVYDPTPPKPQAECPACGSAIPIAVAVCRHCNAVVDEAKAREFFPERFHKTPAPIPPATKA